MPNRKNSQRHIHTYSYKYPPFLGIKAIQHTYVHILKVLLMSKLPAHKIGDSTFTTIIIHKTACINLLLTIPILPRKQGYCILVFKNFSKTHFSALL